MYQGFTQHKTGELVYLTGDTIPLRHAFTTRLGGVSEGSLASLNLGEHRGDREENVRENYRRLTAALGLSDQRLVFTRQVHGAAVKTVTAADIHTLFTPVPYEADGIVTAERGLVLTCFTADCVPVLLADPQAGVAGAVHCGWRSSVADILGRAVAAMAALGAQPARIRAAIGPASGACCFETGPEVPEAVLAWLGRDGEAFIAPIADKPGKFLVDLKAANARRLTQLGLPAGQIAVSEACTRCNHETFWSHRYTRGDRGSQAAVIAL